MAVHLRARDERGAAATALLVTALLLGLAAFAYLALPFGLAVDVKARNRTAADAAALAAAEAVREDLLAHVASGGTPGAWTDVVGVAGLGRAAAERYAALNRGRLVEYWFDPTDGTAHVAVEGQGVGGVPSRSTAVARLDLPGCDAPPQPGPSTQVSVSCHGFDLDLEVRPGPGGVPQLHLPPGQLVKVREAMDVRLVA